MAKEQVGLRMSPKLKARLDEVADTKDVSFASIVERYARLGLMVDEIEGDGGQVVLRKKDGEEQILKILI